MDQSRTVVGRAERLAAVRAWKAVPFRTRLAVLRAAKRGERHPDEDAVVAGQRYVRAMTADRGPRWHQRTHPLASGVLLVVVGTVLVVSCAWLLWLVGPGDVAGWSAGGLGVLAVLCGVFAIDFHVEARRLLALGGRL